MILSKKKVELLSEKIINSMNNSFGEEEFDVKLNINEIRLLQKLIDEYYAGLTKEKIE